MIDQIAGGAVASPKHVKAKVGRMATIKIA